MELSFGRFSVAPKFCGIFVRKNGKPKILWNELGFGSKRSRRQIFGNESFSVKGSNNPVNKLKWNDPVWKMDYVFHSDSENSIVGCNCRIKLHFVLAWKGERWCVCETANVWPCEKVIVERGREKATMWESEMERHWGWERGREREKSAKVFVIKV